jgi:hypothetical protein
VDAQARFHGIARLLGLQFGEQRVDAGLIAPRLAGVDEDERLKEQVLCMRARLRDELVPRIAQTRNSVGKGVAEALVAISVPGEQGREEQIERCAQALFAREQRVLLDIQLAGAIAAAATIAAVVNNNDLAAGGAFRHGDGRMCLRKGPGSCLVIPDLDPIEPFPC